MIKIDYLTCEFLDEPLGIDIVYPRLAWKITSDQRNVLQIAYCIMVSSSKENLEAEIYDLWDSGRVDSKVSNNIKYEGVELISRQICWWKVNIWLNNEETVCSEASMWEMGLLVENDWSAKWIGMGSRNRAQWSPIFRKEFYINKKIKKARAYVTGLGYHELYINGIKVADRVLDPAQTDYEERVFYIVHDITALLKEEENAVGIMLGDGFYHQNTVWGGGMSYGFPKTICQIEIEYDDCTINSVISDESFKCNYGPILRNNVYTGEVYDARLEQKGWNRAGFDDSEWYYAKLVEGTGGKLCSQIIPPVKRMQYLNYIDVKEVKKATYIFDMGRNISGWVRLVCGGPAGTEITMRYAEALDENGMLNTDTGGTQHTIMPQTDRYICRGEGEEIYEPRFTYNGFRYVEVTGFVGVPRERNIKGVVVYTSLDEVGKFSCSDEDINKLNQIVKNTITCNIQGIITDCPVREKCGWLGDAMIIADTVMYNWDTVNFWEKYARDIVTTRKINGHWMQIAPGKRLCGIASPAWGSAQVVIPWLLYQCYNDRRVLEDNYEWMKGWTYYLYQNSENNLVSYGLGDWCPPENFEVLQDSSFLISSAYYYLSVSLTAKAARLLCIDHDAEWFGRLEEKIKKAYNKKYYNTEKHTYGSQTADSFSLELGLVPTGEEQKVAKSIAEDIISRDYHLTTGHIGVRYVFPALTDYGFGEIAIKALKEKTYPGFGHQLQQGATTLWERWGGVDYSLKGITGFGSLNHPFKGGFGHWLYSHILGIKREDIGFENIQIKPYFLSGLTWAKGSYNSIYGEIEVEWKLNENGFTLKTMIPCNTNATVYLPCSDDASILENGLPVAKAESIGKIQYLNGYVTIKIGSGSYLFEIIS